LYETYRGYSNAGVVDENAAIGKGLGTLRKESLLILIFGLQTKIFHRLGLALVFFLLPFCVANGLYKYCW
jgi:hypothetical protein